MNRLVALLGSVAALGLAAPASAATIIPLGTVSPVGSFLTPTLLGSYPITSVFSGTISGANVSFDYLFEFATLVSGTGSGSLSTSSSGPGTVLTFDSPVAATITSGTDVETFTAAQIQTVGGVVVPITGNVLDIIEIKGTTGASAVTSTFSGTATFTPTVPEPATWATFLLGFGFLGLGLRRRSAKNLAAA